MEMQTWRKVIESDLDSISLELKELVNLPCVIILTGEMGAGKTTFVRHFVKQAAPRYATEMMSPTYSIINDRGPVVHADFYRLESEEEILTLELELYLEHTDFFIIEWGKKYLDRIQQVMGYDLNYYELEVRINDNGSRDFKLDKISSS